MSDKQQFRLGLVGDMPKRRFDCCPGSRFSQGTLGSKQKVFVDFYRRSLGHVYIVLLVDVCVKALPDRGKEINVSA